MNASDSSYVLRKVFWFALLNTALIIAFNGMNLMRRQPVKWSNYSHGPLVCVSDGTNLQCALQAPEAVQVEPETTTVAADELLAGQRLNCIALAVFTEARGEPELGQAAVARTVLNRARAARVTECDVVTAVAQYQGIEKLHADPWLIDEAAWHRAVAISTAVATDSYDVGRCATATNFIAASHGELPASWRELREVCRVGDHRFYSNAEG